NEQPNACGRDQVVVADLVRIDVDIRLSVAVGIDAELHLQILHARNHFFVDERGPGTEALSPERKLSQAIRADPLRDVVGMDEQVADFRFLRSEVGRNMAAEIKIAVRTASDDVDPIGCRGYAGESVGIGASHDEAVRPVYSGEIRISDIAFEVVFAVATVYEVIGVHGEVRTAVVAD